MKLWFCLFLILLSSDCFAKKRRPAQVSTSYKRIKIEDMRGFHWSITNPPKPNPFLRSGTVSRDVNWMLDHPEYVAELRAQGTKILCYFNLGRLQANPWKNPEKIDKAYVGVYRNYKVFSELETCEQIGDKWAEPWISWKPENQEKALVAYTNIIEEAKSVCDGLEYDNHDVAENILDSNGKKTYACGNLRDIKVMLKKVCDLTHKAGMSCFMKNSFELAKRFSKQFDGIVAEQCFTYEGNAELAAGAFKGKPVACIEYQNTDVEIEGFYNVTRYEKDCVKAKKLGVTNFWIETSQQFNGTPLPGKYCE